MLRKEIPPFVPKLENEYDTKYFYEYPSSIEVDRKMQERANGITNYNTNCEYSESIFDNF